MRLGPGALAAACACALGACASGDGLLIDVDVDGSVGDPVGAIDVWVGEPGTLGPDRFVRLPRADDVQPVDGFPFEILIEPDGQGARQVWVGAFGYPDVDSVGGPPVAVGAIAAPVDVVPGQLTRVRLRLFRYDGRDADCLFMPAGAGEPARAIVPAEGNPGIDCDDDGASADDCDDLDPGINPSAAEDCDGIDNDCNGVCDDKLDADRDGYSQCTIYTNCGPPECIDGSQPATDVVGSCDCDDSDPFSNPNAVEQSNACDGADNDCDPATGNTPSGGEVPGNHLDDDCNGTCDVDDDGDLIATGDPIDPLSDGSWAVSCEPVMPDCDDGDPEVYPNALERCDGIDSDCDPLTLAGSGPCLIQTPNGCELGTRPCNEVDGALGWGVCLGDPTTILDDGECADWNAVADAPWPAQAYYDLVSDDERDTCTLEAWRPFDGTAGTRINELCDPAPAPRAHIHPRFRFDATCVTQIAGGSEQGGYHLELVDRGTNAHGPRVNGCDVDLVVLGVSGDAESAVRLPSIWVIVVQQRTDDGDSTLLPVEIRPEYADASTAFACDAGPWFHCD